MKGQKKKETSGVQFLFTSFSIMYDSWAGGRVTENNHSACSACGAFQILSPQL